MNDTHSMSTGLYPSGLYPSGYEDVNQILARLLAGARLALGENFVGLYLYGSLAGGDFDPRSSDIDFVVVTAADMSAAQIEALEKMHGQLWETGGKWAAKLEGSYVPRGLLRRHVPHGAACPTVNECAFYCAPLGSDWVIQRHLLRESGVTVEGPDPRTLIDEVAIAAVRGAVLGYLWEWWQPMLAEPSRLAGSEYAAYAVLSMCRVLYTLEFERIGSKPVSAAWARAALGQEWASLIDQALAWPGGDQPARTAEVIELIRLTVARSEPYRPAA